MTQEFYPMGGEQWVTAGKVASLEKRIEELAANKLEASRLLVDMTKAYFDEKGKLSREYDENDKLTITIAELTAEKEEMLKLLYGRDLEIERLAEALGKCSQAREAVVEWVVNLYPHLEDGINEILMGEGR